MKANRPLLLAVAVLLLSSLSAAQITGFPPYGSFENGVFDGINRGNLNTNFSVPITHFKGRGLDLNVALVYDSVFWQPTASAWSPADPVTGQFNWGWRLNNILGTTLFKTTTFNVLCGTIRLPQIRFSNYVYVDSAGTRHSFAVSAQRSPCTGKVSGTLTGRASDNSGYEIILASDGNGGQTVYSPSGAKIEFNRITDSNGNFISSSSPVGGETDYTDTLGRVVLKIINGTGTETYNVLDKNGNYQQYVLTLTSFSVTTNFGCSGVAEYSGTATVPSQLQLPNGRSYTFTYDPATARLKRVTLPTGGFYEYDYPTTAPMGINCADGTYTSLTRLINDGTNTSTWTFSRDTTAGMTAATFPQLPYDAAANQTTYAFTNGLITAQKSYQGTAGGILLKELDTSYAPNNTPAATNITMGSKTSRVETDFDNFGNLTGLREFDWGNPGTGTAGAAIRSATFSYLPDNGLNMVNRVTQVAIRDGGTTGPVKSLLNVTYDETANYSCVTAPPPSHDDTNYGCSFFSRGNPTTITAYTDANTPAGPIVKHRFYDSLGNLLQTDADLCQVQRFVFSSATQYAFPDSISCGPSSGPSVTQQWSYNAFTSLPVSRTDENNQLTQFSYDILNRLTQIARPDQQVINMSYDDTNVKIITDIPVQGTDRRQDITSFDGLARPIRETVSNNAGVVISNTSTTYDPVGNIFSVSTPYASTATDFTITHYDALSRITAIIAPGDGSTNGTTTSYSYADNSFTLTDPTAKQIQYQLDGVGRIQAVNEPDVTNGNSLTQNTSYAYTVRDELKQVTQGSQSRVYTYDDAGRLVQVQTPESGVTNYQFNQFDLITQRTDNRGVITTYGYDGMNRLSSTSYNVGATGVPPTASLSYIYGTNPAQFNNGRLLQLVDGLGSEVYSYDALGRRTNIAKTIGTVTYNLGYGYNLANQIASITYPSGRLISYNHDSYGRLASVNGTKSGINTTYASNYTYNPDMEVTGLSYGNGVTGSFGFNSHNFQLSSLSYSNPTQTLFSTSYGYGQNGGNNGQISQITDNIQPGRSVSYSYDALKRIQSAVTVGSASFAKWGLSWAYDRYGNRNSQTVTAGTAPSQSASADVTTNHVIGYGYDANGNLTFEPSLNYSYTYDAQNHLVGFSGNGTSSFGYDGNGFRVKKVATDGTVTFYIFAQGRIIAEYLNSNPGANPGREFVYQEDGRYLLTIAGDGTLDYYHPDHLSVRLTTDAAGNDAGDRGTYPYGELWYSSGQFTRNNFSTYKLETESNTDYAEFRYYSLRAGRFMQTDPISGTTDNPQSWNLFAYVIDDPVNRLDRLGLQTDCSPNDHGGLDCATGPVVEVNGSDDNNGPVDPSLLGGGGAPAPFPGDNGGGPGATPGDPNKNPKKVADTLKCASEFSNNHSLAALFGAQNTTLGKILGGNTIGGIVDVGLAIGNNAPGNSVTSIGASIIPGGARLGVPGGGPGSKGAAGIAQDAALAATFDASIGAGGDLTQLGLSAGEASFSAGLTGAEFASGVGEAKFVFDALAFLVGAAKCATR